MIIFNNDDKVKWVKKNLGEKWLAKLVMCSDKTLIKADYLIDDKPFEQYYGSEQLPACWKVLLLSFILIIISNLIAKQIIYDQPYNRESTLPRIYRWKDWNKIVLPQMLIHSDLNPYAIAPCLSLSLTIRPPTVDQQRKQDLIMGDKNEPLTPDELSTIAGTLSFINSGDTPSSSPKSAGNEDRKKFERRKYDSGFDRKSVFDETDVETKYEGKTL